MSPTSVLVDPALLSPHPIRRPSGSSPSSLSIPKTPLTPSKRRQSERELEHASNPSIAVVDGWVGSKKQRGLGSDSVGNSKPTPTEQVERAPASVDGLAPSSVNDSAPSSVGPEANIKELPHHYMDADINDLVILIASMLTKLIHHNDQVPLLSEHLTRFHSRSPPSMSVIEYLRRIVRYTNIEKSPLLILLPYLDAFSVHLPSFTLSSLTVHRFLIASACIASKALCDSFCTNAHYAKVGGIKVGELNLLERELISGLDWSLTCDGALLQSYYTSLITSYSSSSSNGPSTTPQRYTQAPALDSSSSSPFPSALGQQTLASSRP